MPEHTINIRGYHNALCHCNRFSVILAPKRGVLFFPFRAVAKLEMFDCLNRKTAPYQVVERGLARRREEVFMGLVRKGRSLVNPFLRGTAGDLADLSSARTWRRIFARFYA